MPVFKLILFFFVTILSVIALILALVPVARRLSLMDIPNDRKLHGSVVPVVGGLAIYLVIVGAVIFLEFPEKVMWMVLAVGPVVLVGAVDDAVNLDVRLRFFSQFIATVLMIAGGDLWITSVGVKVFGDYELAALFAIPITVFGVMGVTNSFNMIDGINGLASGQMLVSLGTLSASLYITNHEVHQLNWILILFSAVFAFLLVNLSIISANPVFLGDAGSLLLGFILAWTLIYYSQYPIAVVNPIIALWCVTIPIFDTVAVIFRRIRSNRSPFTADRAHLHHLLLELGFSSNQVLIIILVFSILCNFIGIVVTLWTTPAIGLAFYIVVFLLFSGIILHPSALRFLRDLIIVSKY